MGICCLTREDKSDLECSATLLRSTNQSGVSSKGGSVDPYSYTDAAVFPVATDAQCASQSVNRFEEREPIDSIEGANDASSSSRSWLRQPSLRIKSGVMLSLQRISFLTERHLEQIFATTMDNAAFRWFAGRAILDFKLLGTSSCVLESPYQALNPLVAAMVEIAQQSLAHDEDLALLQLIINLYKDGDNSVRPHTHRCRQVCASLGGSRELQVGNTTLQMRMGDVMPLNREIHAIPPARGRVKPRISFCLFYASTEEYTAGSVSVNARDGHHGESFWWVHPADSDGGSGRSFAQLRDKACDMRAGKVQLDESDGRYGRGLAQFHGDMRARNAQIADADNFSGRTLAELRERAVDMRERQVSSSSANGRARGKGRGRSNNGRWSTAAAGYDNGASSRQRGKTRGDGDYARSVTQTTTDWKQRNRTTWNRSRWSASSEW